MSKQTIKEKILKIKTEKQQKANTKTRVGEVLDDINESKAEVTDIPTKTSELLNTGADGINKYITAQDISETKTDSIIRTIVVTLDELG